MDARRKLARSIDLTPEQVKEVREDFNRPNFAAQLLADMVYRLTTLEMDNTEGAWDALAKIAGFDDAADLHAKGMLMKVNYVASKLELYEMESRP